jgi:hypothetical protein
MIGRFEARDLRGDFFASPLAQGGEDQGEGFERTRFESILTLPLSFEQGEATPYMRFVQIF